MSTLRLSSVEELIPHVTVIGKLLPETPEDYMKLVRLAWSFRKAVELMIREVVNGASMKDATKKLYQMLPNYIYLESAYKHAKFIVEGCKFNNGNPRHIHVKKLFIISRGNKYDKGNRNIKMIPSTKFFQVFIKYPWDSSWIKCRAFFGERYISLLRELLELANQKKEGYGTRIVLREGRIELHVSVPLFLYLKHFSLPERRGYGLVAGLDLNSDRINMVIIDPSGRIVAMKTAWFPEVTLHGFPRDKARDIRLKKLKELLSYARRIGVDYIVFENLFEVKKRSRVRSPSGNRKITRFAKKQLLQHGLLMSLKLGLTPILVDPKGTTHSQEHEEVMKKRGLDRHMASAYIIACKGLKVIKNHEK
ncbi:MAG: hypothetical protein DRJ40_11455 [Thermoprotei archaeon]|nr:MAG: hypothetical protein DRJ40_11455 [Thermoprotei archaeon]